MIVRNYLAIGLTSTIGTNNSDGISDFRCRRNMNGKVRGMRGELAGGQPQCQTMFLLRFTMDPPNC